jgi:hypothetical protein
MDTQVLADGQKANEGKQLEMLSASTSCDGSDGGSRVQSVLMGDFYREADPVNLCRAICVVYDRWIASGKKPGSDTLLNCTRTHRPALVAEISAEWERITGCDPDDDLFPYHESYVLRKWGMFRRLSPQTKRDWIQSAKSDL